MSILVSGDFHANVGFELNSITKKALLKSYGRGKYNGIKYHIILGDGMFMWPGCYYTDMFNYLTLAKRPFPVLCVIGNHDPILGMSNTAEVDIGIGEKVLLVNNADPFVAYLKRGKVYTIDGFKVLALGGALSIDKEFQKKNNTWWKQEYWSEKEKRELFKLLEIENDFDLVLSHTGPHHINKTLFDYRGSSFSNKYRDEVAILNDEIHEKIKFQEWWCGHWHRDRYYFDRANSKRYQYLYRNTQIIEKFDGKLLVYNEYDKTRSSENEKEI